MANDFCEDDEPVEKIRAVFDREPHGVTTRPSGTMLFRGCYLVDDAGEHTPIPTFSYTWPDSPTIGAR